jgi:hypothetical protein
VEHYPADISWAVADRRTFGVLPGRAKLRTARIRAVRFFGVVRAKIVLLVEFLLAHAHAQLERFRLRRQASALARERSHALQELGEATFYGDRQDVTLAKEHVAGLETQLQSVGEELEEVDHELQARIGAVQRDEGVTDAVEPVPEPAPEPAPVPSEPPGPVIVPEPEPVPHEPPGPVIVPEPQPPAGAHRRR